MHEFAVDVPLGRIAGLRMLRQTPADRSTGPEPAPVAIRERAGNRQAPRVLALHGWLDNAASFLPLSAHLDGIDLVAPDLPGHGASVHLAAGADYSFAGAVHSVLDIADALGWERFALLGHSMGAGIASLVAAACPQRVERLLAIEALGALAEAPERTVARMREAVAAARALPGKRLRVFPDLDTAVRARMQAGVSSGGGLTEPVARLLVERGVVAVADGVVWSSDPRLTLPTLVRMTEAQIANLVPNIECATRVIYAEPAQPYFPEPMRSERVRMLPRGECIVLPGSHHLHMEDPLAVAGAIGDFFLR